MAIVAAHPDDETVGLGTRLRLFSEPRLIHLTDGAPRDLADARRAGFVSRETYAAARERELEAALACLGAGTAQRRRYGYPDQESVWHLSEIVGRLTEDLRGMALVVTHPYEHGHPDHDTAAVAVQRACAQLAAEGADPPLRAEFACYHLSPQGQVFGCFFGEEEDLAVAMSPEELERKRHALACFRTQSEILAKFDPSKERIRAAPCYHFDAPAPPGQSFYDAFGWGITASRWRETVSGTARESSVETEILEPARLADRRSEWLNLWRHSAATPFQSPAWLLPWASAFAPGRCAAAVARPGGRLIGMLPFFTWRGAAYLAGTGASDYGDGLFASGHESCAGALLETCAGSLPPGVDRFELRQLPPESPLATAPAPPGWRSAKAPDQPCPVLQLAGEDGMDCVPRRLRRDWKYALRRLEREGARLDLLSDGDSEQAAAELERLHALRWSVKGEDGVLREPMTAALLRRAIPELALAGILRMHRLSIGDRAIGILFAIHAKGRTLYYLGGYDPDWSRLSPGTALVGSAIAQAAREGATHFDFLRGQEPYKYRWGAQDRSTVGILLRRTRSKLVSVSARGELTGPPPLS